MDNTYATVLNSEGKMVDQTRMENEKVASYLSQFRGFNAINELTDVFHKPLNYVCYVEDAKIFRKRQWRSLTIV